MKCPKRVIVKASYENKELIDNDSSCFSPRSLFALPSDGSSFMFDSLNFVEENSDQDLLLDVPSNGSFPQAELLHPALSYDAQQASTSSSSIYPHLVHRWQCKRFLITRAIVGMPLKPVSRVHIFWMVIKKSVNEVCWLLFISLILFRTRNAKGMNFVGFLYRLQQIVKYSLIIRNW